jgi:dynein heavy chain
MIVASTNKVCNLEDDLMPFLQKEKQPNFPITEDFPWVVDALAKIQSMFQENIVGPNELLEKYKQYEYILNVDRKQLIKDLFGESKAAIKDIRDQIKHYDDAYMAILNLSNDVVDYPMFRVMTAKMKEQLSHQANKIKETLLENVYTYCKKTVEKIFQAYEHMNKVIMTEPTNERELVATREFIKDTPNKVEQLSQELNEVYRHYCLLDDFSYKYADADIETFWIQKQWPLEISSSLTDGLYMVQNKEVLFMSKLDQEKEGFVKSIEVFKQNLEKIKKFTNLDHANEYAQDAQQLNENLTNALEKIK